MIYLFSQLGANEFLNIDAIIEGALHKCVVKPLRQHMYQLYVEEYSRWDPSKTPESMLD